MTCVYPTKVTVRTAVDFTMALNSIKFYSFNQGLSDLQNIHNRRTPWQYKYNMKTQKLCSHWYVSNQSINDWITLHDLKPKCSSVRRYNYSPIVRFYTLGY